MNVCKLVARKAAPAAVAAIALVITCTTAAQTAPRRLAHLPTVDSSFFARLAAKPRFARFNNLSPEQGLAAARLQVNSVPVWQSSFTFSGTTYPYVMVGKPPSFPGTSRIDVSIIPIRIVFDSYVDSNGNPITLDPSRIMPLVTGSPLFNDAGYPNGFTQYGDAIQRANFPSAPATWHTLLNRPSVKPTIDIHVQADAQGFPFQLEDGTLGALVDIAYFDSQRYAATDFRTIHVGEFVMWIVPNVLLSGGGCCILGYHGPLFFENPGGLPNMFTFAVASWLDNDVSEAVFTIPDYSDASTLSHETAEWIDDPFIINLVPRWEFPSFPCSNDPLTQLLEVGDPIAVLLNHDFEVSMNGFTYHLSNEALLPWFTRESPSSAFGGAYSFPNPLLSGPSPVCP